MTLVDMTTQKNVYRRRWIHSKLLVNVLAVLMVAATRTQSFILRPVRCQCCDYRSSLVQVPSRVTRQVPFSTILSSNKEDSSSRSDDDSKGTSRYVVVDYNDDAFGLVFLCGSFVAQDVVFSTTFLLFSAVVATACKQGKIQFTSQVPAVVAGLSFLVANLLSLILIQNTAATSDNIPGWLLSKSESALQVEIAVCFISIQYGFIMYPLLNDKEASEKQ